jgi:hypothetical protein
MQFLEIQYPIEFNIRDLKIMGCYPLKINLPSLVTFQEMNIHQELISLQNLEIWLLILNYQSTQTIENMAPPT